MNSLGPQLYEKHFGPPKMLGRDQLQKWMSAEAAKLPDWKFSAGFVLCEWGDLVDTWRLHKWEQHREVRRLNESPRKSWRVVLLRQSHRDDATGELPLVVFLSFSRRNITDRFEQPMMVESAHPLQGRQFNGFLRFPWGAATLRSLKGRSLLKNRDDSVGNWLHRHPVSCG